MMINKYAVRRIFGLEYAVIEGNGTHPLSQFPLDQHVAQTVPVRENLLATISSQLLDKCDLFEQIEAMAPWTPDFSRSDKPRYLAIADILADDIRSGALSPGDRLPPQRRLAERLGVDFTTVARGYVEAQRRGLVESHVGRGSFVKAPPRTERSSRAPRLQPVDLSMNLPPEPDDPALIARMQEGLAEVARDIVPLLRYQGFGGSPADKDAASSWLSRRALVPSQERIFVTPGAHPALLGIVNVLAKSGDVVLCEELTYPGIRAVAAQVGVRLIGLPMDEAGVTPDALVDACGRHAPKAIYLNPTLQNPTTRTIPQGRRDEIAKVARRFRLPIIEDDAYGFIPDHAPHPFAALAPELTWHVAGLAKCIGAGLRAAYVVVPDARAGWPFAAAVRTACVMASPLTGALVTRWIEDGTADALLRFIRNEARARQAIAREALRQPFVRSDPLSFNLWIELPQPWTRSAFVGHLRSRDVGVVPSDAFTTGPTPIEAVRVCLGGPIGRDQLRTALDELNHLLSGSPDFAALVI
jgi:DNA-binding transcriptional MocR family regulator